MLTPRLELTHPEEVAAAVGRFVATAGRHPHAARNPGTEGPGARSFRAANVEGTAALAKAVAALGSHGAGPCGWCTCRATWCTTAPPAPYADDATIAVGPLYARSKADAEAAVLALLPDATVVRTSLIYGLDRADRSTAGFLDRLAQGDRVALFRDVIRQPVHVESLADALIGLAVERTDVGGTLNVAGDEAIDRAAFAAACCSWAGGECPTTPRHGSTTSTRLRWRRPCRETSGCASGGPRSSGSRRRACTPCSPLVPLSGRGPRPPDARTTRASSRPSSVAGGAPLRYSDRIARQRLSPPAGRAGPTCPRRRGRG